MTLLCDIKRYYLFVFHCKYHKCYRLLWMACCVILLYYQFISLFLCPYYFVSSSWPGHCHKSEVVINRLHIDKRQIKTIIIDTHYVNHVVLFFFFDNKILHFLIVWISLIWKWMYLYVYVYVQFCIYIGPEKMLKCAGSGMSVLKYISKKNLFQKMKFSCKV